MKAQQMLLQMRVHSASTAWTSTGRQEAKMSKAAQEGTEGTCGSMEEMAAQRATSLRSGLVSKGGKEGKEAVGVEAPEPRMAESRDAELAVAAMTGEENLTMAREGNQGSNKRKMEWTQG